ncbi:cytochrome P450 [Arthrobacter sp. Br18]|uniref:bifunctional cytochrome P450/NADPH--P450 reductase n=1 Tax=Arthrobacter sp. Br18 TaxID=1312954 RepID=UPI0020A63960|nr:cytochrome P450 [Arthrobacter sp. Br18]
MASTLSSGSPIPGPPPKRLIGNLDQLDPHGLAQGFMRLAGQYGEIVALTLPGRKGRTILVSSQRLADELCDEERFDKSVHEALEHARNFAGDGLFTAWTEEESWGRAHRVLMPAFGPLALRGMFDGMADVADQLLLKWERLGTSARFDVALDTTRLTLDTIALCSFNYRFNSFYTEGMNPFVEAMVRALEESAARMRRLSVQTRLMPFTGRLYRRDIRLLHDVADRLIDERLQKPVPEGPEDILGTMLHAADPVTGERLSKENVRYQMVTFLIAGHETTSGLLTFAIYELLRNAQVLARAQAEVDAVLGNQRPSFEHLRKLPYLDQVLKETLRLWPTAPAFAVHCREEGTVLGGRYRISREDEILVLLPTLHRDVEVWGSTAEVFEPNHFSFENARSRPPNSWKPFGNGQHSCIGRGFALQEAQLFLAMLLQRFDLSLDDPHYSLTIRETLTLKPSGMLIRATRRAVQPSAQQPSAQLPSDPGRVGRKSNGVPLMVLYGSNSGSSRAFAHQIVADARQQGYVPSLATLDSAVGHLPTDGAVVVVCASYEGLPPDNARRFVPWADGLPAGSLGGVHYAVFGCGNRDWARTYQTVPRLIDESLARAGASRFLERGETNARGDLSGEFEDWYNGFWGAVNAEFGQATRDPATGVGLDIEFLGSVRDSRLRTGDLSIGTVVSNRELVDITRPGGRSTRHLEFTLPEGMTYHPGDYLAVLPLNPGEAVRRALSRFNLAHDDQLVITHGPHTVTHLPVGTPITAGDLLSGYVELSQPATRRQVGELAAEARCLPEQQRLQAAADDIDAYDRAVLTPRCSVLDVLARNPSVQLSFGRFLQLLPPLAPRQYSISSSPRWRSDRGTLTVAAVRDRPEARGSRAGVCSSYLARVRQGSRVALGVRPANPAFHPPARAATPMVLVCAGSGIAPFRGFLQDRAVQMETTGTRFGTALLFFGCHGPDTDFLYRDELAAWEEQGVVEVRAVYSRDPEDGLQYVQDCLWAHRVRVLELMKEGATFYVCGNRHSMASAVRASFLRIYSEETGMTAAQAAAWQDDLERRHGRYVTEVFA